MAYASSLRDAAAHAGARIFPGSPTRRTMVNGMTVVCAGSAIVGTLVLQGKQEAQPRYRCSQRVLPDRVVGGGVDVDGEALLPHAQVALGGPRREPLLLQSLGCREPLIRRIPC